MRFRTFTSYLASLAEAPSDGADVIPFLDVTASTTDATTITGLATSAAFAGQYATLVNVLSIDGVDPTGATSSQAALNAWLAAPPAGAAGLWFPAGTYVGSLQVRSPGLTLAGSWRSIIKVPAAATGGVNDAAIRVLAPRTNIVGLAVDGNFANNSALAGLEPSEVSDGIAVYASDVTVRNCHIYDPIGHGIIVWGLAFDDIDAGLRTGVVIEGNRVKSNTNRAAVDVAFNESDTVSATAETCVTITGNIVTGNTSIVHTSTDVAWTGNKLYGLTIHTDSRRVTVTGNTMTQPINVRNSARVTVSDNVASSIEITSPTGGEPRSTDVTVSGNTLTATLNATDADSVMIVGNRTTSMTLTGLTDVTVSTNQADAGITVTTVDALVVSNNLCQRVNCNGVTDAVIASNKIEGSTASGVALQTGCTNVVVQGNLIKTSTADGVLVGTGSGALNTGTNIVVANNVIDGCTYGILTGTGVTGVDIRNNVIRNASTAKLTDQASSVLVGNGQSFGRVIVPPGSTLGTNALAVWPAINQAWFSRFSVDTPTTARYVRFQIGVASGNIQAGIVRMTSAAGYSTLVTSGVIACPTAGYVAVDLGSFDLTPGDYAVFIWADNTTVTIPRATDNGAQAMQLTGVVSSLASGVSGTGTLFMATSATLAGVSIAAT